jgi:hypothetical protein
MKARPHAEVIKAHVGRFIYCEDGRLLWAENYGPRARKGCEVGSTDTHGYRQVNIDGSMVLVHRVIWYMHHGTFPEQVDHINRDRRDNRIENLRASNNTLNTQNSGIRKDNKSGTPGVHLGKDGKWRVRIRVNGKRIHLGSYHNLNEASSKYMEAKKIYHPHASIIGEIK